MAVRRMRVAVCTEPYDTYQQVYRYAHTYMPEEMCIAEDNARTIYKMCLVFLAKNTFELPQ